MTDTEKLPTINMKTEKILERGMYPYELPISLNDSIDAIEKIKSFFDMNIEKLERWIPKAGYHDANSLRPIPKIEFKVFISDEIKAGSKLIEDGSYIIYISNAALVFIYDLFNRMLSYKNILPEIGNSEDEELEEPSMINYGILERNGIIPKNKERKYFAGMLIDQALWFMFQHELSHILRGHVDYNYNISKEANFTLFNESKLDPLTRQTLEMDADSYAICWMLKNTINLFKNKTNVLFPLSIDKYIEYSFISVYSLMRLCYGRSQILVDNKFEQEQSSNTHPSWRLRQYMVVEAGLTYVERYYNALVYPKSFVTNVADILLNTEKAYKTITGLKPIEKVEDFPHVLHFSSPHTKNYLEHWNLIKPELEHFSYIKLKD